MFVIQELKMKITMPGFLALTWRAFCILALGVLVMLHPAGPGMSLCWHQEGPACPPTSPRPLPCSAAVTGANTHPLHDAMQKPVRAKPGLLPRRSLLQKCCSFDSLWCQGAFVRSSVRSWACKQRRKTSLPHFPITQELLQWMDGDTEVKARVEALLGASVAWPLPDLLSAG